MELLLSFFDDSNYYILRIDHPIGKPLAKVVTDNGILNRMFGQGALACGLTDGESGFCQSHRPVANVQVVCFSDL